MKSRDTFFCCAILFLMFTSVTHAAFFVYFKDGSYREVTKIEFKGQYVELYLTTGKVLRQRKDAVDFKSTGIQPPVGDDKVTIQGPGPGKTIVEKPQIHATGPSQDELRNQWNQSKESAIALRDSGSIHKGDTVRVISANDVGHTVIVRMADGNYKRIVINSEIFVENFEMKTDPKNVSAPETPSVSSVEQEQQAADPEPRIKREIKTPSGSPRIKPSLAWPLSISMGLLGIGIVSTILLSKTDQPRKRRIHR